MDFIQTKITGVGTDETFGTQRGCYPFGDSILAETTLRYISLKKNGGKIDNIRHLRVVEGYTYSDSDWSSHIDEAMQEYPDATFFVVAPRRGYDGALPVVSKDGFESTSNWRIPVATAIASHSRMDTAIYVNSEKQKVFIFVRKITSTWIELFCSMSFVLLPWLYGENYAGFDEAEQAFFNSIRKGDSNTFTKIVDELCKDIDFSELKTKAALHNWCNSQREAQIERLRDSIKTKNSEISSLEESISRKNVELASDNENLCALLAVAAANNPNEFYEFFKSRKLYFVQKSSNYGDRILDYAILETIENYDRDEFLRNYNMSNSYMRTSSRAKARKVLYAIFAEEKAVIRTECVFRLTNLAGLRILRNTKSGFFDSIALPHPHLFYYGCLGANEPYINQYLRKGDWDMAIDQSVQAAKNINFGDSTVVGNLMDRLFTDLKNCKFLILPDGREMNPVEFLKYIEDEEREKTNSEQGESNNG